MFVANVYRQDFPVPGFTLAGDGALQPQPRRRPTDYYDNNGFLDAAGASLGDVRPHDYESIYLGYQRRRPLRPLEPDRLGLLARSATTTATRSRSGRSDIRACFAAAELSRDFDWMRLRVTALLASGDKDPYDDKATGFDAILENPQFAGADTSYWIRQAVPLIGGGGVALVGPQRRAASRCAPRRSRASRTSSTRAWCCSASAPTST